MSEGYRYDRVLLKLSGEALAGDVGYGIDPKVVDDLADQIAEIVRAGVVMGAGRAAQHLPRLAESPRAWIARRPTTSACWPR